MISITPRLGASSFFSEIDGSVAPDKPNSEMLTKIAKRHGLAVTALRTYDGFARIWKRSLLGRPVKQGSTSVRAKGLRHQTAERRPKRATRGHDGLSRKHLVADSVQRTWTGKPGCRANWIGQHSLPTIHFGYA